MANFHSILSECKRAVQYLEDELKTLKIGMGQECDFTMKAVDLCGEAIRTLKKFVVEIGFENQKDEIYFFKTLKPQVNSKLFFYMSVFDIQTSRPDGNIEFHLKVLKREQKSAKSFLHENREIYQYYRSGSIQLDHQYFLRGKSDLLLLAKNPLIFEDPLFSTSYDYLFSKVIANEMFLSYLGKEIHNLSYNKQNKYDNNSMPMDFDAVWTDSKIALIELVYALDSLGSINKGNIHISKLSKYLERAFNIDLGDLYHAFGDMKLRKKERTKFLDSLKNALIKRMDELDEK
ncbi:MAG: RteC domain-containing protein [Flavobacteriaceae bacterium]|nr:RteC domain-containing protein [Flavobacteriaceae bacterium]